MQRPTSVIVFGILNIIFAGLGGFGLLGTIALFAMEQNTANPVIKIMHDNPLYAEWLKLNIFLGALGCAALLASGIGLLFLQGWGRLLAIGYGIYAIVVGVIGTVINFIYLVQPLLEQAKEQQGPEAAGAIGGAIGGSIGGCIGLVYPVLLLIFMFRPKVVAAFRRVTMEFTGLQR